MPLDKLFDRVKNILSGSNIDVVHFDKVLPNPTCDMVGEGLLLANENNVDFVLSVGGGSSMDTAKIIALIMTAGYRLGYSFCYRVQPFQQAGCCESEETAITSGSDHIGNREPGDTGSGDHQRF